PKPFCTVGIPQLTPKDGKVVAVASGRGSKSSLFTNVKLNILNLSTNNYYNSLIPFCVTNFYTNPSVPPPPPKTNNVG
ncbi:MAG: hypothetical protein LUD17_14910, partial [Bacteroidales bacterium]|nr:hypothetical protein [Bacteroidales bacterium]